MKRSILLALSVLLLTTSAFADIFVVAGFKHEPTNLAARVHARKDNNDETCGLILVRTSILNLGVLASTGVAGYVDFKDGYYWVYLSPGTRRISFYKRGFERLNYDLPQAVKSGETYILTLRYRSTDNSSATNKMGFVVINSEPPGADVYINDSATGMQTPFQNPYLEGYYRFTLKKSLYADTTGSFEIHPGKTTQVDLKLLPNYGGLTVGTTPEVKADVVIDGDNKGTTPLTVDRLSPGQYTIQLSKKMYLPWQGNFTISKGKNTQLSIPMKANFGIIDIIARKGDMIYLDNQQVGTDSYRGRLLKGTHIIRVEHLDYYTQSRQVEIIPGQKLAETFTLQPKTGTLSVMTNPIGANIFIDNKGMGQSPKFIDSLKVGIYTVKLQKPGYATEERQVAIAENQTTTIRKTLSSGIDVIVSSQPAGAKLYIDGKYKGTTPLKLQIIAGGNTLSISKNYYETFDTTMYVVSSQVMDFKLKMYKYQLTVQSIPDGAIVAVNDANRGVSPCNLNLPHGKYQISLFKRRYLKKSKYIRLNNDTSIIYRLRRRVRFFAGITYTPSPTIYSNEMLGINIGWTYTNAPRLLTGIGVNVIASGIFHELLYPELISPEGYPGLSFSNLDLVGYATGSTSNYYLQLGYFLSKSINVYTDIGLSHYFGHKIYISDRSYVSNNRYPSVIAAGQAIGQYSDSIDKIDLIYSVGVQVFLGHIYILGNYWLSSSQKKYMSKYMFGVGIDF